MCNNIFVIWWLIMQQVSLHQPSSPFISDFCCNFKLQILQRSLLTSLSTQYLCFKSSNCASKTKKNHSKHLKNHFEMLCSVNDVIQGHISNCGSDKIVFFVKDLLSILRRTSAGGCYFFFLHIQEGRCAPCLAKA